MGGGGVGSDVPHDVGRKRERGGVQGQQPGRGAGMAPGGAVGGGSARSRRRRAGEQGRATRLTGGAERQRGPVSAARCKRERGKRGSVEVGRQQAGPTSTVPRSADQTRF
jgi:hypothetical protein